MDKPAGSRRARCVPSKPFKGISGIRRRRLGNTYHFRHSPAYFAEDFCKLGVSGKSHNLPCRGELSQHTWDLFPTSWLRPILVEGIFCHPTIRDPRMHEDLGNWEGLGQAPENLPMDTDKEILFKGFPPLPKVFRESSSSPSPSPLPGTEQEVVEVAERRRSGLRDKITWLHAEMRRVRQTDWALFEQLHSLALEIQDLRELQQEMESLSKEELFAEEQGQAGEGASPAEHVLSGRATAAFELTI